MMNNIQRVGRITSSSAHKIIPLGSRPMTPAELVVFKKANPGSRKKNTDAGFQTGGETYLRKKRHERKLGKLIPQQKAGKSAKWGNFMELVVYDHLHFKYKDTAKSSLTHRLPEFAPYWAGSPDLIVKDEKVASIKSYWLENFCDYADVLMLKDVGLLKKHFPQEYWQMVSNADIVGVPKAEAIAFCPYENAIPEIQQMVNDYEGPDVWDFKFIADSEPEELPCLPVGGHYESLTQFEFTVPEEDTELLRSRVREAIQYLTTDKHLLV